MNTNLTFISAQYGLVIIHIQNIWVLLYDVRMSNMHDFGSPNDAGLDLSL